MRKSHLYDKRLYEAIELFISGVHIHFLIIAKYLVADVENIQEPIIWNQSKSIFLILRMIEFLIQDGH